MARPVKCDHCGKEEELEGTYKIPPQGWLTVNQAGLKYWPDYASKDLCSVACVVAFLTTCVAPPTPTLDDEPQLQPETV